MSNYQAVLNKKIEIVTNKLDSSDTPRKEMFLTRYIISQMARWDDLEKLSLHRRVMGKWLKSSEGEGDFFPLTTDAFRVVLAGPELKEIDYISIIDKVYEELKKELWRGWEKNDY